MPILNHHKLKKNIQRKVGNSRSFIDTLRGKKHVKKHDFAWNGPTENPYCRIPKKKTWRVYLYAAIIFASFALTIFFVIFSSYFQIKTISCVGINRIQEAELKNAVTGILNYKKFFIPQSSYFTADLDDIRDVLKQRFPIQSIVIKKIFPDGLLVTIQEKISTIIYDNGIDYSYMDMNGNIIEKKRKVGDSEWKETRRVIEISSSTIGTFTTSSVSSSSVFTTTTTQIERIHYPDVLATTAELGNYPIVYDTRNRNTDVNRQVLDASVADCIINWFTMLQNGTQIKISYFTITDDLGSLMILTGEGWTIKTQLHQDVQTQISKLQLLLKNKINRKEIKYVDLRYDGRAFWK